MDKTFKQKLEILPIKIIQHPVGDTEYYAAVHVKSLIAQADKEFQELKEQHGNQAESILLMLEEIDSLKSQLQQQALPVVPEFVAEWIEILKTKGLKPLKNPETYEETGFTEETLQDIVFWISEHQEDYMRAWLDGYTVEKPQLFYLKNKITGKYLRSYTGLSMDDRTLRYEEVKDKRVGGFGGGTTFTQQEIDSMQTGSYEQIEVAE
nr:MAG TPA: Protein of unknown function (DUF1642) [Caudoviricetes sp.]